MYRQSPMKNGNPIAMKASSQRKAIVMKDNDLSSQRCAGSCYECDCFAGLAPLGESAAAFTFLSRAKANSTLARGDDHLSSTASFDAQLQSRVGLDPPQSPFLVCHI